MKKMIAVFLTVLMLISMLSIAASAAVISPDDTKPDVDASFKVNGKETNSGFKQEWSEDEDGNPVLTVESTERDIDEWGIEGMTEGEDYVIVSKDSHKAVFKFLKKLDGPVTVITKSKDAATPDNGDKAPATGADAAAAGMLVFVGIALVAVSLKKERA